MIAYAIGLSGFVLIKVFASGYFSRQDTKTPVKIGVVAMVSNIVLSLLLITPLAHAGLAFATSLASFINAGCLFYFLFKRGAYQVQAGWVVFMGRLLLACIAMSCVLFYFVPSVETWLAWDTWHRILNLGIWIVAGVITYIGVLFLGGLRPANMTLDS